jgi:hypothetical protein
MSLEPNTGMTPKSALRLEFFIIGLGLFALILIFQPFSIALFSIGCMLVVLAGLVNNILPLAQPGVKTRTVITISMVVAMIFCIVLLVSIWAAYLYGKFFLAPPNPDTTAGKVMLAATPFYLHPFVWSVAAIAAILAVSIWWRNREA